MVLAVDFAEAAVGDVSINFGCADAGVAEEFLDDSEVRAVVEEVSGEAVAEHVRGNIPLEPGAA
jgi:hypothetical protein